ncbi:AAA family ATPase [Leifsonia shinshuensis]|uniref:helix-turn-helix transcriptional regulator n=1 Tax=Leifsonia shinshuensis TaxID=150026 RepID=UPI00286596D3|nr:AAA family ATPase [Leifsonia shinshuensis]MDR6972711.1 DNA-binding CsgD family transcriptional regulator [Leifsonia shinshuensis]
MHWPDAVERVVRSAVESAVSGTPTVLDITGETGYGKSTLARQVAREFPPERVLRATGYENDQADTLGVIRQLDSDIADNDPSPLRTAARLGRKIDELQLTGPVALIIDDIQWADPESIDTLAVLLERMAGDRVLVVTTHRAAGRAHQRWLAAAERAPRVFRVGLTGMDDAATLATVVEIEPDADPAVAPILREHTAGSPLFIRSLLHEHRADELLSMAERGSLPAPSDLIVSLRERLAAMDAELVDVLEALAVLGDAGADVFVVAAVADAQDIDRTLVSLRSELLVSLTTDPVRAARIAHGALRAAVYDNIDPAVRKRLHGRAAARVPSPRARLEHRLAAATAADDGLAADLDAFADELHAERRFRQAARIRRKAAFVSGSLQPRTRRERDADFESILALDLDDVALDGSAAGADPRSRFTLGARRLVEREYPEAWSLLNTLSDDELEEFDELTEYRARVLRAWAAISAGRPEASALADLEIARRSAHPDPALGAYFSIAYGQASYAAEPPDDYDELLRLLDADRSDLASTSEGLARLAWRGTSMAVVGVQRTAIADLDVVRSRLGDGIFDFGDGAFFGFQGLAYFIDGQWGRSSITLELARTFTIVRPAPVTAAVLPLAGLIAGDRERTLRDLDDSRAILLASPQLAAVRLLDMIEIFTLALLGTSAERAEWLGRRTSNFGRPEFAADAPTIWCVAQAIAAGWAGSPEAAAEWAPVLRGMPFVRWAGGVATWLEAMPAPDPEFAARIAPITRVGLPDAPFLQALLELELARRSTGAVRRDAAARAEALIVAFGGDRVVPLLFPDSPADPGSSLETVDIDGSAVVRPEPTPSVLAPLSEREREIATLLLEGLSYAQIGRELYITRSTVSFHLTRIYAKTGTTSRHELVQAARSTPQPA